MAAPSVTKVFKILPASDFNTWKSSGTFSGAGIDIGDGFIHLSTASQSGETYKKWFSGQSGLVVAEVDLEKVEDTVKWEPSRGGDLFAHVYGKIPYSAVTRSFEDVNVKLFEQLEAEERS
ncbi:hypothetical protein CAC42_4038 [Sphaceloma murrayae]|uniref:DUF952 domain-containing protein n=1 Tax=Sphaceloma murrayae TaxID=2082308 RepID=A0A2K1QSW6_9PEZI|nr:hypothetical protein CAC42_4038 [Sphaceloma murrayae]